MASNIQDPQGADIFIRIERVHHPFAWEDKFKRLLLRFEHIQQRHYAMKLMGYTLINVRHFCGTSNLQPLLGYVQRSSL